MEEIITLQLTYGVKRIYNLEKTRIQPLMMSEGYALCYKDDKYERGIIYRSTNHQVLEDVQDEIWNSLSSSIKLIKVK